MISFEPVGNVAVIRLDRASKRNALTPTMLASLAGAFDRASSAHAVVLSAVGDVFCAGFDLSLCRDDPQVLPQLLSGLSKAVVAMRTTPAPVVLCAHGAAVAGGCALLGGADFIITDDNAKLGYPVLKLGISPAVTTPFLRLNIGDGPCRARVLDPNLISGRDALRAGLVHESLATPHACEPRALALAQELAAKPPEALRHTKGWLNTIAPWPRAADALAASLSLVGGPEERSMLPQAWAKK